MSKNEKVVDAYAEWDDRAQLFRVFLIREPVASDEHFDACGGCDECDPHPRPLVASFDEATVDARLYRAVFVAHPKDLAGQLVGDDFGWATVPPAERAAKAVKKELKRIAKGEPPIGDFAVEVACMKARPSKGRR